MIPVRESFGAKVLAGLLGTVGILLLVTFWVVRGETDRQVAAAATRAVTSAESQFAELDALQRRLTARLARPFTEGRRAAAALEDAIVSGDIEYLAGTAEYEVDLAQLTDVLVAFTDAAGEHIVTLDEALQRRLEDPLDVGSAAVALLEGTEFELRSFRVMDGGMYSVRTILIDIAGRPVGTVSFGLPVDDDDLARIGAVVGVEVCFVVAGACVAGTPQARERLAPALAGWSDAQEAVRSEAGGQEWSIRAQPLVPDDPGQGTRVVAVPLDPVLAPFERIRGALFLGGGGALLVSLLVGMALTRGLTRPVRQLVAATQRVAEGDYDAAVSVSSRDEIGLLATSFNDMTRGLLLKERYRSVLDKVVSRDVAEELLKGDVELGGENRRVTVLFADIRGFTPLTEGMEPQRVIELLNECMERLSSAVETERGVVDKYVGDELMAVFGAPLSQGDDALRAVRAAVRMRAAIEELNAAREARGAAPIGLGVGINTGLAVAGNMGSKERLNYTVLGSTVNLASRLCSAAAAGQIIASGPTLTDAGDAVRSASLGLRDLKGFSEGVELHQVEGVGAADAPGAEAGRGAPGASGVALALLVAGALGAPQLSAQDGAWPTLSGLGVGLMSASGALQLDFSGQLDLEVLHFTGHEAGLGYNTAEGLMLAPRVRLFADLFAGRYVYGLVEVRADRGEAPTDTVPFPDVRLEQAFLRVSSRAGGLAGQAGRFVSPFGSYPARHLSDVDPFVRPPLPYDRRTVMSGRLAAVDADAFLRWRDSTDVAIQLGRPPVWGVPYQWGAMVSGQAEWLAYRLAAMNGPPSAEFEPWGRLADLFDVPNYVIGADLTVSPELTVGGSYSWGPFTEPAILTRPEVGSGGPDDWPQQILALDAALARGPVMARVEFMRDLWKIPNVQADPVELGYTGELQVDVLPGLFVAGRVGRLDFHPVSDGLGGASPRPGGEADWDYDVTRWEGSVGYRLARNAGVLLSGFVQTEAAGGEQDDDLLAVRMWWRF